MVLAIIVYDWNVDHGIICWIAEKTEALESVIKHISKSWGVVAIISETSLRSPIIKELLVYAKENLKTIVPVTESVKIDMDAYQVRNQMKVTSKDLFSMPFFLLPPQDHEEGVKHLIYTINLKEKEYTLTQKIKTLTRNIQHAEEELRWH